MAHPGTVGVHIFSKAWSEIKKINWHEVNHECQENFHIGLVGTPEQTEAMKNWLVTFPSQLGLSDSPIGSHNEKQLQKHITNIAPYNNGLDEKLIASTAFCLTSPDLAREVRRLKSDVYLFDPKDIDYLPAQILTSHGDLRFALSYHFPVFRPEHACIVIQDTALQNALWAIITASPNAIPGTHQVLCSSIEGVCDFTMLTLNEIKLLFELVGISGELVAPMRHIPEFGLIVGIAVMAQNVATNLASLAPARSGLLVKGAAAYAFTYAIGEALFFYITAHQRVDRHFFERRIRRHYEQGRKVAAEIINT